MRRMQNACGSSRIVATPRVFGFTRNEFGFLSVNFGRNPRMGPLKGYSIQTPGRILLPVTIQVERFGTSLFSEKPKIRTSYSFADKTSASRENLARL